MSKLTPEQIAAIRERADFVTVDGKRPPGVFGSVYDLLSHIAAVEAERDAAQAEAAKLRAAALESIGQFAYMIGLYREQEDPYVGAKSEWSSRMNELQSALTPPTKGAQP